MAIYEVGAGTGKATILLARRGLRILAIEPDADMAERARSNCAPYPDVDIVESDFEHWEAPERRRALISAQAWHWLDPAIRYRKAHEALIAGGTLVALWTFPEWRDCRLGRALSDAYRVTVPHMRPDFPMHPDSDSASMAGDWSAEIGSSAGTFTDPVLSMFAWSQQYTAGEYVALAGTHQDHILLPDKDRDALLNAIRVAIERAGGGFALPYVTRVCLATRAA